MAKESMKAVVDVFNASVRETHRPAARLAAQVGILFEQRHLETALTQ